MTSIADPETHYRVAGIGYPKAHFGRIWRPRDLSIENLWPWELTLLERDVDTRIANSVAPSYAEAQESLRHVVSLWISHGSTLADEREANILSRFPLEDDPPDRRIGFR